MVDGATLVVEGEPTGLEAVPALLDRAAAVDGFGAVNEAGRLALGRVTPGRVHLIRRATDATGATGATGTVAYASLDVVAAVTGGSPVRASGETGAGTAGVAGAVTATGTAAATVAAELVVDPAHRRRGIGAALLHELLDLAAARAPGASFSIWAHRDTAAARALAVASGLTAHRTLLLLRRPPAPLPDFPLPPGVRLAVFRPGVDEAAWLAVNAAAFATHPEQGRWTLADVADREAEDWFEPAGLLLAWSEGPAPRLLGSHWTKIPRPPAPVATPMPPAPATTALHTTAPGTTAPVGEVYVLAVAPDARTPGLGTALAVAGLASLAARGVEEVELYVEADNTRALRLYQRLGFVEHSRDMAWGTTLTGGPGSPDAPATIGRPDL